MKTWIKAAGLFLSGLIASTGITFLLTPSETNADDGPSGQVVVPETITDADQFIASLASMKKMEGVYELKVLSTSIGYKIVGDSLTLRMASLDDISFETTGVISAAGFVDLPYRLSYTGGEMYAAIDVYKWTLDTDIFRVVGDFIDSLGFIPDISLPSSVSEKIMEYLTGMLTDIVSVKNVGSIDYTLTNVPLVEVVMHSDLDYGFTGMDIKPFAVFDNQVSFSLDVTEFSTVLEEEDVTETPEDAEEYVEFRRDMGLFSLVNNYSGTYSGDEIAFELSATSESSLEPFEATGSLGMSFGTSSRILAEVSTSGYDVYFDGNFANTGSEYYASLGKSDDATPLRLKGSVAPATDSAENVDTSDAFAGVIESLTSFLSKEHTGAEAYLFGGLDHLGLGGILPQLVDTLTDSTLGLLLDWRILDFLAANPIAGIELGWFTIGLDMSNSIYGGPDGNFRVDLSLSLRDGLRIDLSDFEFGGLTLDMSIYKKGKDDASKLVDLSSMSKDPDLSGTFLPIDELTAMGDVYGNATDIGFAYSLTLGTEFAKGYEDEEGTVTPFYAEGTMSGNLMASWTDGVSFYADGNLDDSYGGSHALEAYLEGPSISESEALVRYSNSTSMFSTPIGLADSVSSLTELFNLMGQSGDSTAVAFTGVMGKLMTRIDDIMAVFGTSALDADYDKILSATDYILDVSYANSTMTLVVSKDFLATEEDISVDVHLDSEGGTGADSLSVSKVLLATEDGDSMYASFDLEVVDFDSAKQLVRDETYLDLNYLDIEQLLGQTDFNIGVSGSFGSNGTVNTAISANIEGDLSSGAFYGNLAISGQETPSGSTTPCDTIHKIDFDSTDGENMLFSYVENINGTDKGATKGYFGLSAMDELSGVLNTLISEGTNKRFMQYFELFFSGKDPWINKLMPLLSKMAQGTTLPGDYAEFIGDVFDAGNGEAIAKDISYDSGVLSLTIDKSILALVNDIKVELVIDEGSASSPFRVEAIRILDLSMGDDTGTIEITNNDADYSYKFDSSLHPLTKDDSYMDFTSTPKLLGYLMDTAGCDLFSIKGTLDLNMTLDLSLFSFDLSSLADTQGLPLEATVWIDENESVYAYIKISEIPSVKKATININAPLNADGDDAEGDGKTVEFYYDSANTDVLGGDIYIHRYENIHYTTGVWPFTNKNHNERYDMYCKAASSDFMADILPHMLKGALGMCDQGQTLLFGDSVYGLIMDTISDHADRTEPMPYSELLTAFSYDSESNAWTLGLNFAELANNPDCTGLSFVLGSTSDEYVDLLKVTMNIESGGVFYLDLIVNATMQCGAIPTSSGDFLYSEYTSAKSTFDTYMASSYGRNFGYTGTDYVNVYTDI